MKRNKSSKRPPSEVRKHYYLDEYVVIAPKRSGRPFTVSDKPKSGLSIKKADLPIEDDPALFEITSPSGQWMVKVVENIYPALTQKNPKAYGHQEIVLETDEQNLLFSQLSVEQIMRVLTIYQARIKTLSKDPKIKHISIFKNHGFEAGASLAHTHSQIIAIDFVPPKVQTEMTVFSKLYKQFGSSPLGAALEWEREEQVRIISNSLYATALAPYASQHPFEVWVIPHRHVTSLCELSEHELASFAKMLKLITAALDSQKVSYNYHLHEGRFDHDHHFVIKIKPRPNIWAGFELDTGVIINSIAPEAAAGWYRSFIRSHSAI